MKAFGTLLLAVVAAAAQTKPPQNSGWSVQTIGPQIYPAALEKVSCHSLEYFLKNSQDFEYKHALTMPRHTGAAPADEVRSTRVGTVEGFAVYTVIHRLDYGKDGISPTYIKMIIVERQPGDFCEIFNDQDEQAIMIDLGPAYLVSVDSATILATRDRVGGTGVSFKEAYWTFDKDGPIPLNLDIIKESASKLLGPGLSINKGYGFDIQELSYHMPVWKTGDPGCCASGGSVDIHFALRNHQLSVVSQHFDPDHSQ